MSRYEFVSCNKEGAAELLARQVAKPKRGETVFFSWIVFKSPADRDRVNAKVMKDPQIAKMMEGKSMPMDPKRMRYGGFKVLVDL